MKVKANEAQLTYVILYVVTLIFKLLHQSQITIPFVQEIQIYFYSPLHIHKAKIYFPFTPIIWVDTTFNEIKSELYN